MQIFIGGLKATTGIMLILVSSMITSSIIVPQEDLSLSIIPLQSNWQIQGLFLSALLFGPQIGTICAISYLILGLFYLPVFHGGGSIGYILTPEFGYLIGFIPAAWICGFLAKNNSNISLINYSFYTVLSLLILHLIGIFYIFLGKIFVNWTYSIFDLFLINSLIPFPSQLLLCLTISLISVSLKRILILK